MFRQGDRDPWTNVQSYWHDRWALGRAPLEDGVLQFGTRERAAR